MYMYDRMIIIWCIDNIMSSTYHLYIYLCIILHTPIGIRGQDGVNVKNHNKNKEPITTKKQKQ